MAAQIKKSLKSTVASKSGVPADSTVIAGVIVPNEAIEQMTGVKVEVQKARSEDLMSIEVPAKETDQTLIVPKEVNGKDRWFAKSAIKSFEKKDDKFVITATRREFAYRGLEDKAQLVAH